MDFSYEIYRLLPKSKEYLASGAYLPLPKPIVLRIIERGINEGLLIEKGGIIYPSQRLREVFLEIPKKQKKCKVEECKNFIKSHSKANFYQAVELLDFEEQPLKCLIEDFPLVQNFKYLFAGIGDCLIDCLEEIAPIDKEQFTLIDIDKELVEFYRKKGYKAYWSDIRFLSDSIIPQSPFDVVVSYHIEYFQTYENVSFAYTNLKNFGYLYLKFATAELEDKADFYSIIETLWHFKFWVVEFNRAYIKAIKIENKDFWDYFFLIK